MHYILALYTKQFLEIKLFTFDHHENISENGWLSTNVLLDQRFILQRGSPLNTPVFIQWKPL